MKNGFDIATYTKQSTKKSGVSLRVKSKSVLRQIARMLK